MTETQHEAQINQAVAEGSAYALIRKRLDEQGERLLTQTRALNAARTAYFGASDMHVISRIRVRTDNNCIARDMVQVGDYLLLGYNVFIGLKPETHVDDVFALFTLVREDGQYRINAVPLAESFMDDSRFRSDFDELYRYYRQTRLTELTIRDGKLLAAFQIGERSSDRRVFRWQLNAQGTPSYLDNRGERDIALPEPYDFLWQSCTREDIREGTPAHINVRNTLFISNHEAQLSIRIEDNTASGQSLLQETLADRTQSLSDMEVAWAEVDGLLLLRIKPYREAARHYLYNPLTQTLLREDNIGDSCVQLPEGHGIIYPGGYALASGEIKNYDDPVGMTFKRKIRAPNGEDMLFVFYAPESGEFGLYSYNLISKSLQNPIYGHGYALSDNGELLIFSAESEATRQHPMQLWQTPYMSDEYASNQPYDDAPLSRIGNPELVRGISDLYSIARLIAGQSASARVYERLQKDIGKLFDDYYWLDDASFSAESTLTPFAALLRDMVATAEMVLDEFEKVDAIRRDSEQALAEAQQDLQQFRRSLNPEQWRRADDYAQALAQIRARQGKLALLAERRYLASETLTALQHEAQTLADELSAKTVAFLAQPQAFAPYEEELQGYAARIDQADKRHELDAIAADIQHTAQGLDELSQLMNALTIADATLRTRIIDDLSAIYARLNQERARARNKGQSLGAEEAAAQFAAQLKLLAQSLGNALNDVSSPQDCDDALARLLVQLENLESRFADYDAFLPDLIDKREDIHSALSERKQQLLEARSRKAQQLGDSAERLLDNITRRAQTFSDAEALNTYLATDALVHKVRELAAELRSLQDSVRADDIEARFAALKDQAMRSLRDKSELFEGDGHIIRLGKHRFSVNTEAPSLTLLPRDGTLYAHLTGTRYFAPIHHPELDSLRAYWDMSLPSENAAVYRSEYLAALILRAARRHEQGISPEILGQTVPDLAALNALVARFAATRYQDGYEKGIHDHDAARLLQRLFVLKQHAGHLRFTPDTRALAQLFWLSEQGDYAALPVQARAALTMQQRFAHSDAVDHLLGELTPALQSFAETAQLDANHAHDAAEYLLNECAQAPLAFVRSQYAQQALAHLQETLGADGWRDLHDTLRGLSLIARYHLARQWLASTHQARSNPYLPEAAAVLACGDALDYRDSAADLDYHVDGLLGSHARMENQSLHGYLDDFLQRTDHHRRVVVPAWRRYHDIRQQAAAAERQALDVERFIAKPLTSFVRNRLINDIYLPIIGDNLAKQMGTVGEGKRTDLMGLLMMISPPGYGKTTLMEYIANRLGLIFMKINCPSLGHDVQSLDPALATDSAARQELERLNLALEMGDNVMLYLDDIQHTHPAFLQKFISLCDGTRRIDGIWRGEAKTYDLRGRKFAVVMAGNPYTESGEVFNVPDMLANRADIYNLGDIIGDSAERFAQSYLENALTSNPVLAPLALREPEDIYRFIRLAQGDSSITSSDFAHTYSAAETGDIVGVLQKMLRIRDVVLAVNRAYIASAAQEDRYRTEPPFRLQGSYRNMNKMSEKLSAIMNDAELEQLIADHYQGEAQLLKAGSEANLLKLGELRGRLTPAEHTRWDDIKTAYRRLQALGGTESAQEKIVLQLQSLHDSLHSAFTQIDHTLAGLAPQQHAAQQHTLSSIRDLARAIAERSTQEDSSHSHTLEAIAQLAANLAHLKPSVHIAAPQEGQWLARLDSTIAQLETALKPLLEQITRTLDMNYVSIYKISRIAKQMDKLAQEREEKDRNGKKQP